MGYLFIARQLTDKYSTNTNICNQFDHNISGIEPINTKFQVLITALKKRNYDFLDQRKQEVDMDLDDFKRNVAELQVSKCVLDNFPHRV